MSFKKILYIVVLPAFILINSCAKDSVFVDDLKKNITQGDTLGLPDSGNNSDNYVSCTVYTYTGQYADAIGWYIEDNNDNTVASSSSVGSNNYYTYSQEIELKEGTYELFCWDMDDYGWHGAKVSIKSSGNYLVKDFTFTSGWSASTSFTVSN